MVLASFVMNTKVRDPTYWRGDYPKYCCVRILIIRDEHQNMAVEHSHPAEPKC